MGGRSTLRHREGELKSYSEVLNMVLSMVERMCPRRLRVTLLHL
jgi:small nuclear ribonucleoprotein (snRNP)-like protein